jgi:hypothetical protein
MTRSLLLTLLVGALVLLLGWAYLARSEAEQERWRRPILAICAVAMTLGHVLMVGSFLQ